MWNMKMGKKLLLIPKEVSKDAILEVYPSHGNGYKPKIPCMPFINHEQSLLP